MDNPTKTIKRSVVSDLGTPLLPGAFIETETEAKCSVELKTLAKGGILVESVKVFSNSEQDAGDRALAEMLRLQGLIDDAAERRLQDQLRRSAAFGGKS